MNRIHINITGPIGSGKSILAIKLMRYLECLGCRVTLTENHERMSPQRQQVMQIGEANLRKFEMREVVINDNWI